MVQGHAAAKTRKSPVPPLRPKLEGIADETIQEMGDLRALLELAERRSAELQVALAKAQDIDVPSSPEMQFRPPGKPSKIIGPPQMQPPTVAALSNAPLAPASSMLSRSMSANAFAGSRVHVPMIKSASSVFPGRSISQTQITAMPPPAVPPQARLRAASSPPVPPPAATAYIGSQPANSSQRTATPPEVRLLTACELQLPTSGSFVGAAPCWSGGSGQYTAGSAGSGQYTPGAPLSCDPPRLILLGPGRPCAAAGVAPFQLRGRALPCSQPPPAATSGGSSTPGAMVRPPSYARSDGRGSPSPSPMPGRLMSWRGATTTAYAGVSSVVPPLAAVPGLTQANGTDSRRRLSASPPPNRPRPALLPPEMSASKLVTPSASVQLQAQSAVRHVVVDGRGLPVQRCVEPDSEVFATVPCRSEVTVVEVGPIVDGRSRARIADPHGWVTLRMADGSFTFAEPATAAAAAIAAASQMLLAGQPSPLARQHSPCDRPTRQMSAAPLMPRGVMMAPPSTSFGGYSSAVAAPHLSSSSSSTGAHQSAKASDVRQDVAQSDIQACTFTTTPPAYGINAASASNLGVAFTDDSAILSQSSVSLDSSAAVDAKALSLSNNIAVARELVATIRSDAKREAASSKTNTAAVPTVASPEIGQGSSATLPEASARSWNSMVRSTVEITLKENVKARARVYLYQAPFAPSVLFVRGMELFALPPGWGVLRSKKGLLVWLELIEDSSLRDAMAREALALGSSSSTSLAMRMRPPEGSSSSSTSVDLRILRSCGMDAPIQIPTEDVAVINPRGEGEGVWAALGTSASGASFDSTFLAWLSAWETSI